MRKRSQRRQQQQDALYEKYTSILEPIINGDVTKLNKLAENVEGFPEGRDEFVERFWITNAIDCGSLASIQWMLDRKIPLDFIDDEGFSPLHSAIDREQEDKYLVIELLLKHGASTNLQGNNDWTPLHRAAARDDVEACRLLLKYGADPIIRTRIDAYATPYEEACILKREKAAAFLREWELSGQS